LIHITTVPLSLFFFRGQVGYMKERGLEVYALSSPGSLLDRFAAAEQISVYAVEMPRQITPLRDLGAVFCIWRQLRRLRPQIAHAHTPKGGLLGMIASGLARVPIRIYHVHGLPFVTATGIKRWVLRRSEALSCALAHQVFCVSPSIRELLIEEGLCSVKKVRVLLNGSINGVDALGQFNPQRFNEAEGRGIKSRCQIPDEAVVVGFIGRITHDKGIAELVRAWQKWRADFPALHLLVVGPWEQDQITTDTMQLLHSDPRVHVIAEWVEDPAPFYAIMDVLAFPTHREGFGLVAIEASAMEIPVVSTRIPGCVDAVQDGVTGTLVPPGDAQALSDAVERYLRDGALRAQHGHAGRERALRKFSPEAIWEALYEEYSRLLREKGLSAPESASEWGEDEETYTDA
jgi:glycosyltransferase involved in cell wall biosynthesis